jgi:hypothetical protein
MAFHVEVKEEGSTEKFSLHDILDPDGYHNIGDTYRLADALGDSDITFVLAEQSGFLFYCLVAFGASREMKVVRPDTDEYSSRMFARVGRRVDVKVTFQG